MGYFFITIAWQVVVSLGIILAFVFAVLWLYRPEKNREEMKENTPNNGGTASREERIGKLQDLLYKHLLTRVYLDKVDEGGNKYKEYNEANDKEYIETLKKAINELKNSK